MKITIFAAGSRGDIQPCLALGKGLRDAGYQVKLAVPVNFTDFVQDHGVNLSPLRGDVQQVMSGQTGREHLEKGGANPLRSMIVMRKMIGTIVRDMVFDACEACREADALICLGVFSPFGKTISEALRIPMINIEPTPLLPTGAFPAPSWPIQRNLGRWHNYTSGLAMLFTIWQWYRPFVADLRRELGLPPVSAHYFYNSLRKTPMIGAYNPNLVPHPPDWPMDLHITGDLTLCEMDGWQPPEDLQTFLAAGSPPVYIGFGSMTGSNPEHMADLLMSALERSGQRGLILTGWSGMRTRLQTDRIYTMESAPHSWLFPRMAAVVHHGGAGTTAEGLRAGVPTVVIPFAFDQFFWGERVKTMGLGPTPIPRRQLTVTRLEKAIRKAVSDPGLKQRALAFGESTRAIDGVKNAVNVVKRYFGTPDEKIQEKLHGG